MNASGAILDLVFASAHCSVGRAQTELIRCDEYHPPLVIASLLESEPWEGGEAREGRYDLRRADYDNMNSHFASLRWDEILTVDSIHTAADNLNNIVKDAISGFVPWVDGGAQRFPRWFSRELRDCVKLKREAHYRYKSTGSAEDYRVFAGLRAQAEALADSAHEAYINSVQQKVRSNIKAFWGFANEGRRDKGIPNLLTLGGHTAQTPVDIANLFADHFESTFAQDKLSSPRCQLYKGQLSTQLVSHVGQF